MDGVSIFLDKTKEPTTEGLKQTLQSGYKIWRQIYEFVLSQYPEAHCEWNFPGKKYGWSYRMKDKRRAIIYFIPQDRQFQVAFVFGAKAIGQIIKSDIKKPIKDKLTKAKTYAEGTGIRLDITGTELLDDVKKLIAIKLAY